MFEFANNKHNAPKHISDEELLELIQCGELVISDIDTEPRLFHRGREVKAQLIQQSGRRRGFTGNDAKRYRWQIERGKNEDGSRKVRRVVRAKLTWMFANKQLVPDDCLIHHDNEDHLDDSIGNLRALSHAEHSEKHYGPDDDF